MNINNVKISKNYNRTVLSFCLPESLPKDKWSIDFYLINSQNERYFLPLIKVAENYITLSFEKIPQFGKFKLAMVDSDGNSEKLSVSSDNKKIDDLGDDFNDELTGLVQSDWGISAEDLLKTLTENETILLKDKWKLNYDDEFVLESLQEAENIDKKYIVISKPEVLTLHSLSFKVFCPVDEGDINIFAKNKATKQKVDLKFKIEQQQVTIDISKIIFEIGDKWNIFLTSKNMNYRFYYPENTATYNAVGRTISMGQWLNQELYLSFDKSNKLFVESMSNEDAVKREKKRLQFDDTQNMTRITEKAITKYSKLKKEKYPDLHVKALKSNPGHFWFSLKDYINIQKMFLINNKTDTVLSLSFDSSEGVYSINLGDQLALFDDEVARFTLYAEYFTDEGGFGFSKLLTSDFQELADFERFFDTVKFPISELSLSSRFYISKTGYLSLVNRDSLVVDKDERKAPVKVVVDKLKVKKDQLYFMLNFDVIAKKFNKNWNLIVKKAFLYKTIFHSETINLNIEEVNFSKNRIELSQKLSVLLDDTIFGNYRLALQLEINDKDVLVITDIASKRLTQRLFSGRMNFISHKRIFFPRIGLKKDLSFFIDNTQQIDHPVNNLLENLTVNLFKHHLVKEHKGKYLLFEKETNYAQDNSFALFEWIQNNVKDNESYYVIKKDSMALSKLQKYKKRVIYTGSLKYYWHILTCDLLVSADNPIQLYDGQRAAASPLVKKVIYKKLDIMLQHGVTAFKNIGKSHNWRAEPRILDYFVVTSPFEQRIVHENLGYSYNQLPILGFTRWDKLDINIDKTNNRDGEILFCPTWRKWLSTATDAELVESDYYKKIESLLNNETLLKSLESKNKDLIVYLHPIMQKYTKNFKSNSEHIKIMSNNDVDLSILIKRCAAIVTDYSSVSWDFAVQRKPVIFYQFDRERYEKVFGSFVDLKEIPIGPSLEMEEDVVAEIAKVIDNDFKNEDQIIENINKLFGEEKLEYSKQTYDFVNDISDRKKNTFWNSKIGRITNTD